MGRRELRRLRRAQDKAVMPLIGPLLDAWEGTPNDTKGEIREAAPMLREYLDRINTAMEDPAVND